MRSMRTFAASATCRPNPRLERALTGARAARSQGRWADPGRRTEMLRAMVDSLSVAHERNGDGARKNSGQNGGK